MSAGLHTRRSACDNSEQNRGADIEGNDVPMDCREKNSNCANCMETVRHAGGIGADYWGTH